MGKYRDYYFRHYNQSNKSVTVCISISNSHRLWGLMDFLKKRIYDREFHRVIEFSNNYTVIIRFGCPRDFAKNNKKDIQEVIDHIIELRTALLVRERIKKSIRKEE